MIRRVVVWCSHHPLLCAGLWLPVAFFGCFAYFQLMPREAFPVVESSKVVVTGDYLVDDAELVDSQVVGRLTDSILMGRAESVRSSAYRSSYSLFVELPDDVRGQLAADEVLQDLSRTGTPAGTDVRISALRDSKYLEQFDLVVAVHSRDDVDAFERQRSSSTVERALRAESAIQQAQLLPVVAISQNPLTGERITQQSGYTIIGLPGEFGPEVRGTAAVGVTAAPGVDSIELRDVVDRVLEEVFPSESPFLESYEANVALDLSGQIVKQIRSLGSNAIGGLIVVLLLSLAIVGLRNALVTTAFIASVLAGSFAILWSIGITLNTVSLLAIILSLGLLVDDAIVMGDALQTAHHEGGPAEAVGGFAFDLVGRATIAGTITTILVFAPMLAITGVLGDFIRILPITVITVLTVSLAVSLFVLPAIIRRSGANQQGQSLLGAKVIALGGLVAATVVRRPIAGALAGIALTLTGLVYFAPRAGFNIFPKEADSTEVAVEIDFTAGLDLEVARAHAGDVVRQTLETLDGHVVNVFVWSGTTEGMSAQINLTAIGDRPTAQQLIDDRLRPIASNFTDGRLTFSQISSGPPEAAFPFKVQVFDEDLQVRQQAAQAIRESLDGAVLSRSDGSSFTVAETNLAFTSTILRLNGSQFTEVSARFDADDITTTLAETQAFVESEFDATRLAELGMEPNSLGFDFGTDSDNEESFDSINLAFGIALALVLVMLVMLFRSASMWILILLAVPFSFFGVFGGLVLSGNPLSFFVMIGLMGLIGIAVNNTILLSDLAMRERRHGASAKAAIQKAIRDRFKPLLLTTGTTVAAVLPLALRDPFWEALGLTLALGLISSTVVVLLAFPACFLALEWLRYRIVPPWRSAETSQP